MRNPDGQCSASFRVFPVVRHSLGRWVGAGHAVQERHTLLGSKAKVSYVLLYPNWPTCRRIVSGSSGLFEYAIDIGPAIPFILARMWKLVILVGDCEESDDGANA